LEGEVIVVGVDELDTVEVRGGEVVGDGDIVGVVGFDVISAGVDNDVVLDAAVGRFFEPEPDAIGRGFDDSIVPDVGVFSAGTAILNDPDTIAPGGVEDTGFNDDIVVDFYIIEEAGTDTVEATVFDEVVEDIAGGAAAGADTAALVGVISLAVLGDVVVMDVAVEGGGADLDTVPAGVGDDILVDLDADEEGFAGGFGQAGAVEGFTLVEGATDVEAFGADMVDEVVVEDGVVLGEGGAVEDIIEVAGGLAVVIVIVVNIGGIGAGGVGFGEDAWAVGVGDFEVVDFKVTAFFAEAEAGGVVTVDFEAVGGVVIAGAGEVDEAGVLDVEGEVGRFVEQDLTVGVDEGDGVIGCAGEVFEGEFLAGAGADAHRIPWSDLPVIRPPVRYGFS